MDVAELAEVVRNEMSYNVSMCSPKANFNFIVYADVAELADALVLGTSVNDVEVQVLSSAPTTFLFELIEQTIQISF